MKKIIQLIPIILIGVLTLSFLESKAQSGTLKSKNGFLLFYASDSLNFTLRLDEPNTETPNWINKNYLKINSIFK